MNCWDRILPRSEYSPEEPDEFVASSIKALKERPFSKILDLGCGAGRHLFFTAKQGLQALGGDLSSTGLSMARKRLADRKLKAFLVKCDMKSLPFADSTFDLVICSRTIYHQTLKEIRETVMEIRRVLQNEAYAVIDFLSKRTCRYGAGARVERDTFAEQEGPEKGVLHHFMDDEELRRLFEAFRTVNIELRERGANDKLRSRWIVTAIV